MSGFTKKPSLRSVISAGKQMLGERDEALAIALYVDRSADKRLVAAVRDLFDEHDARVGFVVATYHDEPIQPVQDCDLSVVVAGSSTFTGSAYALLCAAGVPTVCLSVTPNRTARLAREAGFPLPDDDLFGIDMGAANADGELAELLGAWIADNCGKALALSSAYPFVRRAYARKSARDTALQNAAIAVIPFLRTADTPLMTFNQCKMFFRESLAYDAPLDARLAPLPAAALAAAFVGRKVARSAARRVPALGPFVKAGVGYGTTILLGRACERYYSSASDEKVAAALGDRIDTARKALTTRAIATRSSDRGAVGDSDDETMPVGPIRCVRSAADSDDDFFYVPYGD